jgi:hypothetical protein
MYAPLIYAALKREHTYKVKRSHQNRVEIRRLSFVSAMLKNWFQVHEKPIDEKHLAYRDDIHL